MTGAVGQDMVRGRVSVVIPTLNRAGLIGETLASLAALRWPDVEVIVVDDGSTDDTAAVISRIRAEGFRWPLDYVWQPNAGPGAARNVGRRRARGTYLYHIDSDDLVAAGALETLIPALEHSGASYAVGTVENTDLAGNRDPDTPFSSQRIIHGDILGSGWYTHAAVYRREIIDRIDGYDERLKKGEDTELHWRIMATAGWPAVLDDLVATRRLHDFGHLGVSPTSRSEDINAILTVYEHFLDACPAAFCTPLNAYRVLRFGIESGLAGDPITKTRCHAILLRMGAKRTQVRGGRLWSLLLKPDAMSYLRGLNHLSIVTAALWTRVRFRDPRGSKPVAQSTDHTAPQDP